MLRSLYGTKRRQVLEIEEASMEKTNWFITRDAIIHQLRLDGDDSKHLTCNLMEILNEELRSKQVMKNKQLIAAFLKDVCTEDDDACFDEILSFIASFCSVFG